MLSAWNFERRREQTTWFCTSAARYLPGLWLVVILTAAAYGLRNLPGLSTFSPMILGIVLGVVLCNVMPLPSRLGPGLGLAGKDLLRLAVAMLGMQVTLGQLVALGGWGLASAVIVLTATFLLTLGLGRILGVGAPLTTLIAAGTSVCGAAAIGGVNGAIRAKDEDVTYAIAAITLFGTLAMFLFPVIGQALELSETAYGTWIGLSVHEVAQVVGAGFQGGDEAGRTAVIVKLTRVILLAPLIMGLAAWYTLRPSREGAEDKTPKRPPLVPWFVLVFLGLSGINSTGLIAEDLRQGMIGMTALLLTASLSALGLGTRFGRLRQLGLRPLLLCALSTGFISFLSLVLATL